MEFTVAHQLAAILSPVKTLISILEASAYPTSNLVKPFIGKMIDKLDPNKSTTTEYRGRKEVIRVSKSILFYLIILLLILHYNIYIFGVSFVGGGLS